MLRARVECLEERNETATAIITAQIAEIARLRAGQTPVITLRDAALIADGYYEEDDDEYLDDPFTT